jgi:uncharacterized protein
MTIPSLKRACVVIGAAAGLLLAAPQAWSAEGPSFDCHRAGQGTVVKLICSDAPLAALDRQLAAAYAQALPKARNEHPPVLKATQRGWIKGRDDCWKATDVRGCVHDLYELRLVELQARYRLVHHTGPFTWVCDSDARNEVRVTHFQTEPPSLIAERGDQSSLMRLQVSASGSRYVGRNESLWEHQGQATVVWGYQAPEMHCTLRKP